MQVPRCSSVVTRTHCRKHGIGEPARCMQVIDLSVIMQHTPCMQKCFPLSQDGIEIGILGSDCMPKRQLGLKLAHALCTGLLVSAVMLTCSCFCANYNIINTDVLFLQTSLDVNDKGDLVYSIASKVRPISSKFTNIDSTIMVVIILLPEGAGAPHHDWQASR